MDGTDRQNRLGSGRLDYTIDKYLIHGHVRTSLVRSLLTYHFTILIWYTIDRNIAPITPGLRASLKDMRL